MESLGTSPKRNEGCDSGPRSVAAESRPAAPAILMEKRAMKKEVITHLFTKLLWQGISKGPCGLQVKLPPVSLPTAQCRLNTVPFIAVHQTGKLFIPIFIVFGMT